jgi:hypothetical protein
MSSKSPAKKLEIGNGSSSGEKNVQPSSSPPRGRSHSRRRRPSRAGSHVIERVIERPSTNVSWPMLSRTNYPKWALVMEVNFQTLGVWDIVDIGIDDDTDEDQYHADR